MNQSFFNTVLGRLDRILARKSEWLQVHQKVNEQSAEIALLKVVHKKMQMDLSLLRHASQDDYQHIPVEAGDVEQSTQMISRPIFINTLPKSGSVFTVAKITGALGLDMMKISYGYFPQDLVDIHKIRDFVAGGSIAQEHLDASSLNLAILSLYLDRWCVHVRDPRQAMLSWVHHLNRLHNEGHHTTVEFSMPMLPDDYFDYSFERQIDYQLENYLCPASKWIEDWVKVSDSGNYNIKITTYEQLLEDEDKFVSSILDFFQVEEGSYLIPKIDKSMKNHFRAGNPDEWRTVMTKKQCKLAGEILPTSLKDRFSWGE